MSCRHDWVFVSDLIALLLGGLAIVRMMAMITGAAADSGAAGTARSTRQSGPAMTIASIRKTTSISAAPSRARKIPPDDQETTGGFSDFGKAA